MTYLKKIIIHTLFQKIKSIPFMLSSLLIIFLPICILLLSFFIQMNEDKQNIPKKVGVTFEDSTYQKYLEKNDFKVIHIQKDSNYNNILKEQKVDFIISLKGNDINIYNSNKDVTYLSSITKSYYTLKKNSVNMNEVKDVNIKKINLSSFDIKKLLPVYFISFLIFFVLTLYSSHMSYDVAQERTSGITEILLTNINPTIHIIGKILAILILSFIQLFLLITSVFICLKVISIPDENIFKYFNYSIYDYVYILIMVIVYLVGLLSLSAFGGSLVNDMKNISTINNFILLVSFGGFFTATVFIFVSNSLISFVLSYLPFFNIYHITVMILTGDIKWWQYITLFITNLMYSVIAILSAAKYYKYSTFININDFKELPKKIKMLKG